MLRLRSACALALLLAAALAPLAAAAQSTPPTTVPPADVPAWAAEAVWYQVFPERFRNGDPSNDPAAADIRGSWPQIETARLDAAGWAPVPWTQDWYRQTAWGRTLGEDLYTTIQLRRYGGDLQGLLDMLPYLDSLGVTALYLNPVNDAPSLHKYDARNYRHADRTFGPDPAGDAAIMAAETPDDPSTWTFTAADSLLLQVIDEVHRRDMRIVLDYSWNHTGLTFWAWQDVLEKGRASRHADWYEVDAWDDPATPENEFAYTGWAGVHELPEWKKLDETGDPHAGVPYDGDLHPDVKKLIYAVSRRWLDPDGDGDPSDGIDGFRLDVAEQVPLGFWHDYRDVVKSVNPDALLIGEIWWQQWPDVMSDTRPYLAVFDAVINYRWYMPTRALFADAPPAMTPSRYAAHRDSVNAGIPAVQLQAMMNVAATHDTPRLATSLFNAGPYKSGVSARDNLAYKTGRPDAATFRTQRLLVLQQATTVGAPHVWNGDEAGMWGADDPDDRKPLVWADLAYETERADNHGRPRRPDPVRVDEALLQFYRDAFSLRREHLGLFARGDMTWALTDDARGLLAYRRTLDGREALVLFNLSDHEHTADLAAPGPLALSVGTVAREGGQIRIGARSGAVFVRD